MATIPDLSVGARCEISGKAGTIRFVGATDFAPGRWVGVELDEPSGKNDGSVHGKRYFDCKQNHGVFARASQIRSLSESVNSPQSQVSKILVIIKLALVTIIIIIVLFLCF
jgi:dynactin 1